MEIFTLKFLVSGGSVISSGIKYCEIFQLLSGSELICFANSVLLEVTYDMFACLFCYGLCGPISCIYCIDTIIN